MPALYRLVQFLVRGTRRWLRDEIKSDYGNTEADETWGWFVEAFDCWRRSSFGAF